MKCFKKIISCILVLALFVSFYGCAFTSKDPIDRGVAWGTTAGAVASAVFIAKVASDENKDNKKSSCANCSGDGGLGLLVPLIFTPVFIFTGLTVGAFVGLIIKSSNKNTEEKVQPQAE